MYHCTLTTKSFSRLFIQPPTGDPSGRNLRRYYAVVPIEDIPNDWSEWLEVNARDSSEKGKVPKAIRETLTEKPEWFAAYNRGLTVVVSSIHWDNQTNVLTLGFDDREYHGVLDGGHTLRAILDEREDMDGETQTGFCNVEIFMGLDESEIPSVVEARNTSKQVASKSLMNLDGSFEGLKQAIGRDKSGLITWKENEEGQFDVRELVAILTALDPKTALDNTQPVVAYSGKEACLKRFRDKYEDYECLFDIAGDALEMWDAIQFYLPEQYNAKAGGRFGGLTGVQWTPRRPKELPFMAETTEYVTPTGYIYPVLSAFRAMMIEEDGKWRWGKGLNPRRLIREGVAADIFIRSVRESINTHRNPNRTGKDTQAWTSAYQAARIMYLEHE
jgi:hypothetical protein